MQLSQYGKSCLLFEFFGNRRNFWTSRRKDQPLERKYVDIDTSHHNDDIDT